MSIAWAGVIAAISSANDANESSGDDTGGIENPNRVFVPNSRANLAGPRKTGGGSPKLGRGAYTGVCRSIEFPGRNDDVRKEEFENLANMFCGLNDLIPTIRFVKIRSTVASSHNLHGEVLAIRNMADKNLIIQNGKMYYPVFVFIGKLEQHSSRIVIVDALLPQETIHIPRWIQAHVVIPEFTDSVGQYGISAHDRSVFAEEPVAYRCSRSSYGEIFTYRETHFREDLLQKFYYSYKLVVESLKGNKISYKKYDSILSGISIFDEIPEEHWSRLCVL